MNWKCPFCQSIAPCSSWAESEVGCDDCGGHPANVCPSCDEAIDMVMYNERELDENHVSRPFEFPVAATRVVNGV